MPLAEFTKTTMEGLTQGDFQVLTPHIRKQWETYEKGKVESSAQMYAQIKKETQ